MKKVLPFLFLVLSAAALRADRVYQLCDPAKSRLCAGLLDVYEFEEASDFGRTGELAGPTFLEPDGVNVANSATHKTGAYALDHAAVANSYVYLPRVVGFAGENTTSFWFYGTTNPSASTKRIQVLSVRDSLGNEGYPQIYLYHDGTTISFQYSVKQAVNDTVTTLDSTQAIATSTWYLVTFGQYPNPTSTLPYQSTLWIQVNAGTRNTTTITYPDVPTIGDLIVGAWSATSPNEYGAYKIDQLASWQGTFSPGDVIRLYNGGSGCAFPFVASGSTC